MSQQVLQVVRRLQKDNHSLKQQLQKSKQEMEYVCLKTGLQSWSELLIEVRAGHVLVERGSRSHQNSKNSKAVTSTEVEGSTIRSMAQRSYELESRIMSEASIRTIKGDDLECSEEESITEREQSLNRPLFMESFSKDKANANKNQSTQRQESIRDILGYIQQYEAQKSNKLKGFDTFRRTSQPQSAQSTHRALQQKSAGWHNQPQQDTVKRQSFNASHQHSMQSSVDTAECLLAMENTRLRKALGEVTHRLQKYQKL